MDNKHKISAESGGEKGAVLAITIIIVAILLVIGMTALAYSSSEIKIADLDLQKMKTQKATIASLEFLTNSFEEKFKRTVKPAAIDMDAPANTAKFPELEKEGYSFKYSIKFNNLKNELYNGDHPMSQKPVKVGISKGPYAGLFAGLDTYTMTSTGRNASNAEVKFQRDLNRYFIPIFQFGVFSNFDLDFSSGLPTTQTGRVHTNKNIYASSNIRFADTVSTYGEFVRDIDANGLPNNLPGKEEVSLLSKISPASGYINTTWGRTYRVEEGSVFGGPKLQNSDPDERGYSPDTPNGTANPS